MRIHAAVALGLLLATGQAFAHAHLRSASPEMGTTGPAPAQLSLMFSELLETRWSRIAVTAPDGAAVADAASLVLSNDQRRMVLKLPQLRQGIYTVKWVAVSIDTHRTEGAYQFTVVP